MDYLHLLALVCLAKGWADLARVMIAKTKEREKDRFYADKLATRKFFLVRILPDARAHLERLKSGAEPVTAFAAEAF